VCKPLSYDHKPTNFGENERIVAGGGYVQFGRVNGTFALTYNFIYHWTLKRDLAVGNLALSRALGDFEFKQNSLLDAQHQIVTADPDVIVHDICGEEEFVVIACDGVFIFHSVLAKD
jgi:protein phosphatase 2C family protein 2/3